MPPHLSIIIPAYNEEKYIEKTLQSIYNQAANHNQTSDQALPDYEIIVVANGCTDKTEEILKKHKEIRYFSLPKANVSVARNAGAVNAQSDLLLFLDADTQLDTNSLQYIHQHYQDGLAVGLAVATTKARPDDQRWKFKLALGLKNLYNSLKLYQGCSGALLCRKEDFQKVGGYDPELMVREHRKLILQLKKLGGYKCLNIQVTTSMRRYQQWGLMKLLWFWSKQWVNDKVGELKGKEYEKVR